MNPTFKQIVIVLLTFIAGEGVGFSTIITQNFDTDPGWTAVNTNAAGSLFGFSNTGNVTGNPGEAGGLFTRTDNEGYYADTTSDIFAGAGLDAGDQIQAAGSFKVTDETSSASYVQIGFRSTSTTDATFFGLDISDTGGNDTYRLRLRADPTSGSILKATTTRTFDAGDLLRFAFHIVPGAGVNGQGQLVLSLTNLTDNVSFLDTVDLGPGEGAALFGLNAFGIGNADLASDNAAEQITVFMDEVSYGAIPEPSTVLLLGVGGALLWRRRGVLNR